MSEVLPRINGTEMEWAFVVPHETDPERSRQLKSVEMHPPIASYMRTHPHIGPSSYNCFLDNGARFYIDCGDHPEYATPEDNSYEGTCANEIAGEEMLHGIAQYIAEEFPTYSLNKRVLGDDGLTWGYHENYSVDASSIQINTDRLALHGVHLATRNIFFGGGAVLPSGDYVIGQKTGDLRDSFSCSTQSTSKPVVNLRDEALSNDSLFRRVHVTSGDPNVSPWASRMKLGTTSLVLRLIEQGEVLGDVRLQSLLQASRQVSHDTALSKPLPLENGRAHSALEIQQFLCKAALQMSKQVQLPEEDLWTLAEWERACADARQNPDLLYDRVDWVLKKQMLDRQHSKAGVDWKSEKMRYLDRRYSEIGPGTPSEKLRSSLWQQWMPAAATIQQRIHNAPPFTRAAIRGKVVRAFAGKNISARVDWQWAHIMSESVKLPNPHEYTHDRIDELIKAAA